MPESSFFTQVRIPQQKSYDDGVTFPAVVSPNLINDSSTISNLTEHIKDQKPMLESLLHKTGAILFRGFPVTSASDFNDVVDSFGFDQFHYLGGAAPRSHVVGRVFTANESPLDQKIPFHHEMSVSPDYPSKLFFFCEVEPEIGGETPIVASHIIYEKMKKKYPEFVQQLEEHGLIYSRVLKEEDNPISAIGRGWKATYNTQDKSVAEERAAKLFTKLKWLDGGVETITGPLAAFKFDDKRQRKIWFNGMTGAYTGWGDPRNTVKAAVTFGDGKALPGDVVYDCLRMLDEESVSIPWKKGDILLVDNMAALHSRSPCNSPRRVLAALCK